MRTNDRGVFFKFLIACLLLLSNFNTQAQTAEWLWGQRAGGIGISGGGADDQATDIAVDDSGNVYVCGDIYDSFFASFDTLSVKTYGDVDMFLAKYNCEGELQWVKVAGNRQNGDILNSVVVDTINDLVYVTGHLNSDNINPWSWDTDTTITAIHNDFFLMQFDVLGNMNWLRVAENGPGGIGYDVVLDTLGNPYVLVSEDSGMFMQGHVIDAGISLVKYDINGNVSFIRHVARAHGDLDWEDMDIDQLGNCYIAGSFQGTKTVAGQTLTSNGLGDGFIVKYDAAGNYQWIRTSDALAGEFNFILAISVVDEDEFYVCGSSFINVRYGSIILTGVTTGSSGTVIKYENANPVWGESMVTFYGNHMLDISVDHLKNLYIAGIFGATATLGTYSITSVGARDPYIAKYNPNNTLEYVQLLPGGGGTEDNGNTIATGFNGNVYLAGSFGVDLQLANDTVLALGGVSDIFVAKFGIPECADTTTEDSLPDGIINYQLANSQPLKLYPNPNNGQFTIETDGINVNSQLSVYNSIGQVVYQERFSQSQKPFRKTINLDLKNGVYFIRLLSGKETYYQKLILQSP